MTPAVTRMSANVQVGSYYVNKVWPMVFFKDLVLFFKTNWEPMNILSILHQLDPSMPLIQKLDTGDVTTCKAIGQVANIPGMDKWCTDNCPNNCPETYCSCKSVE